MALTDFFRINMPYGIQKNANNEWMAFNREYKPLGFNIADEIFDNNSYPIWTAYKGLTKEKLLKLSFVNGGDHVGYNQKDEISIVFFYDDATNPQSHPKFWNEYFEKIKILSKLKVR